MLNMMLKQLSLLLLILIIFSCKNETPVEYSPVTGWVQYTDTLTYTFEKTLIVDRDSSVTVELKNLSILDIERPEDMLEGEEWYDIEKSGIVGSNFGDGYILRIDFDAKSLVPSNNFGEFQIDIGTKENPIIIQRREINMPSSIWKRASFSFNYYTLEAFNSNGGRIVLYGSGQKI